MFLSIYRSCLCISVFFFLLLISLPINSHAESSNSIGMQFVTIPAGRFVMGSCVLSAADKAENASRKVLNLAPVGPRCRASTVVDEQAATDETPQHEVRFDRPFQLSRHEVTLRQFTLFIAETGRSNYLTDDFLAANAYGDDAPVVAVSWEQTQAFIAWLNRKEGGHHYRLPSEAEWEYAARAGTHSPWSFKGRYRDYAWYQSNSDDHPHTVAQKKPNPWGLYDMHGNAWEWVADWYADDFYQRSEVTAPMRSSSGTMRVARGGGWNSPSEDLRCANRGSALPDQGYDFVGFRLARE